jgi:hypothetical protein
MDGRMEGWKKGRYPDLLHMCGKNQSNGVEVLDQSLMAAIDAEVCGPPRSRGCYGEALLVSL